MTHIPRSSVVLAVIILSMASSFYPPAMLARQEGGSLPWSVMELVEYQLSLKKDLGVQDVYKMLFQANFGVGHLPDDTSRVRSSLLRELASVDTPRQGEELIERISTDDSVVRINLRPFKARHLNPEELMKAMVVSAAETKPDTFMFLRQWNEFYGLVQYGVLHFPFDEAQALEAEINAGRIVPLHHSEAYTKANAPAYRVVRRSVFQRLVRTE